MSGPVFVHTVNRIGSDQDKGAIGSALDVRGRPGWIQKIGLQ